MPKPSTNQSTNPIVYYYRGKPIRKYNLVAIRLNEHEFRKVIDGKIDKGLSPKDLIKQNQIISITKLPNVKTY